MNNQSLEQLLKEFDEKLGWLVDDKRGGWTVTEPQVKSFIRKVYSQAREQGRRDSVEEIRGAFLERGKEQGQDTILWTAKEIVELMDKLKLLEGK